jgi:tyrosyl-tRNA synthetase
VTTTKRLLKSNNSRKTSLGRFHTSAFNRVSTAFIDELKERGLITQISSDIIHKLATEPEKCAVYAGFDPTGPSLHIGHLLIICTLAHFQRAGFKPIALVGGATGLIGDPSGRSDERPLLDEERVEFNRQSIERSLTTMLGSSVEVVNNYDWYRDMSAVQFLRGVGRHFRLGTMLAKDSVKSRLDSEAGLSFTEFSYQMLQAYDFHHLYNQKNCKIQIGGNDQWGNITAGIELIRKINVRSASFPPPSNCLSISRCIFVTPTTLWEEFM